METKQLTERLTTKTEQFKNVVKNTTDELDLLHLKNIVKDAICTINKVAINKTHLKLIESELRLRLQLVNTQLLIVS